LGALAAASCSAGRAPAPQSDPAAAADAFAHALQEGDAAAAWALLSARTQADADQLAARARVSADGGPESGRAMLLSGAFPLGAPVARELWIDGGTAALELSTDGGPAQEFRAVREAGAWKIELDLHPAPTR